MKKRQKNRYKRKRRMGIISRTRSSKYERKKEKT